VIKSPSKEGFVMLERVLWWLCSITWLIFFVFVGFSGAEEGDVIALGLGALGLLCLAIAADLRAIRLGMEDRET